MNMPVTAMPVPRGAARMSDWITAGGEIMSVALADHPGRGRLMMFAALPDAGDHARFEVYEGGFSS